MRLSSKMKIKKQSQPGTFAKKNIIKKKYNDNNATTSQQRHPPKMDRALKKGRALPVCGAFDCVCWTGEQKEL